MDIPIRSITDLRGEIYRLKGLEREQSMAIGQRFNSPSAIFSTIVSLFSGPPTADGTKSRFFEQDIVGLISRFVLPFTLNRTLFRKSNFIVKTLVGLISQKASHFITEDSVGGVWDKIKSFIPLFNKNKAPNHHSGVPAHKKAVK